MAEFEVRAIDRVPKELLDEALGKPESMRVVAEEPRRGLLSRAWRAVTGAAQEERMREQIAQAQESARLADEQAARRGRMAAIEGSPITFTVHEKGAKAMGFATAEVKPNSFGAHLPPYFTVTGFHLREGAEPEAGARLLRKMAEEAHGAGAKYVALPRMGKRLQEVLDHERRRLRSGDESGHIGEVETRLREGMPHTGLKLRERQRHRK